MKKRIAVSISIIVTYYSIAANAFVVTDQNLEPACTSTAQAFFNEKSQSESADLKLADIYVSDISKPSKPGINNWVLIEYYTSSNVPGLLVTSKGEITDFDSSGRCRVYYFFE